MRKLLFLVSSIIVIGGSVYALFPGLFPDTSTLPRVPTGDGTIGKILTLITGESDLTDPTIDGTVKNTLTLSGITSTGYLRSQNCGAGVYTKINPVGQPTCGNITPILADYGTINKQACQAHYYRSDGSDGDTATGHVLKAGDVIKTTPGCPIDIVFADHSIIRLDGDTTVSLDLGYLADSTTIASALVENGSLWGRILTGTGSYSIGTPSIIVGVRGTSVYAKNMGIPPIITWGGTGWILSAGPPGANNLSLVHSTEPILTASGTCIDGTGATSIGTIPLGQNITGWNPSIGCAGVSPFLAVALVMPDSFYTLDTSIAKYTIEDLRYMSGLIASGSLSPSQATRIRNEFTITEPTTTVAKSAICSWVGPSKTYWESLLLTRHDVCQDSTLKALAIYSGSTTASGTMYTQTGAIGYTLGGGFSGASMPRFIYSGGAIMNLLSSNWDITIPFTASGFAGFTPQYLIQLIDSTNNIVYQTGKNAGPGAPLSISGSISSTFAPTMGNSYTLRIVKTGTTYQTYINGVIQNTSTLTTPLIQINIGKNAGTAYWLGSIDKIEIKQ